LNTSAIHGASSYDAYVRHAWVLSTIVIRDIDRGRGLRLNTVDVDLELLSETLGYRDHHQLWLDT
jgi:hypothetical protein